MTIDDKSLSELIELGEKATERPWLYDDSKIGTARIPGSKTVAIASGVLVGRIYEDADRAFIAASANLAIPLALEVRRLRGALRDLAVQLHVSHHYYTEDSFDECKDINCVNAKEALRAQ